MTTDRPSPQGPALPLSAPSAPNHAEGSMQSLIWHPEHDQLGTPWPMVSAAAYSLILERTLGPAKIPDDCMVFAAGDTPGPNDGGILFLDELRPFDAAPVAGSDLLAALSHHPNSHPATQRIAALLAGAFSAQFVTFAVSAERPDEVAHRIAGDFAGVQYGIDVGTLDAMIADGTVAQIAVSPARPRVVVCRPGQEAEPPLKGACIPIS